MATKKSSPPVSGIFQMGNAQEMSRSFMISFKEGHVYAKPLEQRLTREEVGKILQTSVDGVAFLAKHGLLVPLGHSAGTQQRYFSSTELCGLMQDKRWLGKVTDALYSHSSIRNAEAARKRSSSSTSEATATKTGTD